MKESARIFRFAVIGTLNALIMAVTVWVMMDELDINYMLSNVTAYILAQIHNFIWCKYWIFPTEKSNTWRQVLLFSIAFGMAYGAQFLFLIGLVEGLDCNEYLAQFLGLFIYGSVNFPDEQTGDIPLTLSFSPSDPRRYQSRNRFVNPV